MAEIINLRDAFLDEIRDIYHAEKQLLKALPKLAKAADETISTNLPASEVDRFIPLAMKARDQKVATLSLVPPMINTAEPDIPLIHKKVRKAIDRAQQEVLDATAE